MKNTLPWLALKSVPGIGNHLFKRLINHLKSPEAVFKASLDDLVKVEGVYLRLARAIKRHNTPESVKKEFDCVLKKGYKIVTMADPEYPALLLQIPDPPPFLYVLGSLAGLNKNLAVVGSRNATAYGISTAKRLSRDLASIGITIVSGLAVGIDSAAHKGALMGGGKTIAVLGSGLERIYPAENRKLFYRIAENGAVISEFSLKTEPEAHNFPVRNRIISGISFGTIVVEATKRSGSLITARLAAEQNREVFAVPGSIRSFKSTGTHTLIKQGAKLVEHARDILEELVHIIDTPVQDDGNIQTSLSKKRIHLTDEESKVFNILEDYPLHIDNIVRKLKIEPGKLSSILLQLELKGVVSQSPGKLFSVSQQE